MTHDTTLLHAPDAVDVPPRAGKREWLGLAVLMLPVLLVSIDNTVLSFALPDISRALSPTGAQLLWIVDIYPLMLAGLLVTMGNLGDRFGRRRLLLIGAAGFGVVSVYAAYATSPEHLITARVLLGVFGATLMPSTLALLRNLFLDRTQRRLAIAIWAAGFSAGAALGPVIGGWLLEHFWWGSIFLINVPVLLVLLAAGPFLLPESRDPSPGRLDLLSVIGSITTMLFIVYGIKRLATGGTLAIALGCIILGLLIGVWFVRRQLHSPSPLLDVQLFKNRVFSASIVANLMSVVALVGLLYFISQYLQLVLGFSPVEASIRLLPGLLATIVMGLAAVALVKRWSMRRLVPIGLTLSAFGFALATQLGAGSSAWMIIIAFILVGGGVGLAETLTNDAVLAAVPPEKAGAASGISETAYEMGAVLGTAVLGSVLTAAYRTNLEVPAGINAADAAAAQETLGGAFEVAETLPSGIGEQLIESAKEAFSIGVDITSGMGFIITMAAAVMVALALRPKRVDPTESTPEPTPALEATK